MLTDEFMPVYDVSDAVATVVDADVAATWEALMNVDLIDVGRKRPIVGLFDITTSGGPRGHHRRRARRW